MALEDENKALVEQNKALLDENSKLGATLEDLTNQLEEAKKELKNTRSTATKASNTLDKVQAELDEMTAQLDQQVQTVANKDGEIAVLKEKLEVVSSGKLSDKKLKKKALTVLLQENVGVAYVSLDGHIFLTQNAAHNYKKTSKKTYKVATLVNGEEVDLTDPEV